MKLIPKEYQEGGILSSIDDYVDKAEPWANGIGLVGAGIGVGTSATGIGAPIGALIYAASQLPSVFVDGYQTIRSATKGDWKNAAWNGTELGLDLLGAKAAKGLAKPALSFPEKKVVGKTIKTGVSSPKRRLKKHFEAAGKAAYQSEVKKAVPILAKRGIRPTQGTYYKKKLNEQITKQLAVQNDAIKSGTQQFLQEANKVVIPAGSQLIQLPFTIHDLEK